MRIVAIADTHTFEADLGQLPAGDVLIHAGDLCRGGTLEELEAPAAWIRQQPHPRKIVVAGNHDWCFVNDRQRARALLGNDVIYLEDAPTEIDGLRFWGSPWQPAFNDWAFNLPRGRPLADKWALIPARTDVLVTHGPPRGFGDRCGTFGREGCADLLHRVRQLRPLLHLFGHIHEDGGLWQDGPSILANITTWEGTRAATVLDVDPARRQVLPVLVPPREGCC